jgi:pimeloyl-ACP methyl ester carboxylesterase
MNTRPLVGSKPARGWLALAALLSVAATAGFSHEVSAANLDAGTSQLTVGSITLQRCRAVAAWCGMLSRPLDPANVVPGSISIYFEFYPHTAAGKSLGTLVATEGGPGFPATESRDEYLGLFQPLLAERDLLLMDNRGTGKSGAVDCTALQGAAAITEENVAACGRSLGNKAPLYSVTFAADDLAAILAALALGPIDLYGDSYGTYFEQVFALRHPQLLRSLVLDGAYALDGPDYAWYPSYAPAMRDKFNIACRQSAACKAIPGSSLEHVAPALAILRHGSFAAQARDADGNLKSFTANAALLATVMFASAPTFATVRELDAAARAFTEGDRAPLLRLMAETLLDVDSRDESHAPEKFSAGLAAAVMCGDAPQIFDMRLPPARRIAARNAAIAHRKVSDPGTYAPFTIDEYLGLPLDYSFIDECVQWPVAPKEHPASQVGAAAATGYPDVPALIISGELDNMTTVADGAAVAKEFAHGRQLLLANSFHVNALPHARSACAAQIVRRFVQSLNPGDMSCAQSVPEVRLVPQFSRRVHNLAAARAVGGNAADPEQLRAVTAAVLTVGDVIARLESNTSGKGEGLRGGAFSVKKTTDRYWLMLRDVRFTEDLAVSGKFSWPAHGGVAEGKLTLAGTPELSGTLSATWIEGAAQAQTHIHGTLGQAIVAADTSAP